MVCTDCCFARRVPSEQLREEGWGGCSLLVQRGNENKSTESIVSGIVCEEAATGWVDLNSYPSSEKGSGRSANFQLLIKDVTRCIHYSKL